jgi:predicted RNA binding protein YcfA (HicA-like mRNA interferase family)
MSGVFYPLTCKQVKTILTNLGFVPRPQNGTSHEHWVPAKGSYRGQFRKVTVDCPQAPFLHGLIQSMARQAGVSKKEFYAALEGPISE